jgi:HlyD family secretion protein
MRSRWVRRSLVLLTLAAAIVAARAYVLRPKIVPVTVHRVARGPVEETVTNSKAGTVKSRRRATLSPEVGGLVVELAVREGARVRRGDLLMRLSPAEYDANAALQSRAVEVARAAEREMCEGAQLAAREADRVEQLVASELVSPQRLDQARSARDTAVAGCEAARARAQQADAALKLAAVQQAKTVIRAPFDGVVAQVSAEVGEWITPAPPGVPIPPVIELIDPDQIYVSAPLDEVDSGKVRTGLPVRVTMDARPGAALAGRLARVAPYVQDALEQNRTFDVEVELDDRAVARTLLPGTSADVEVILQVRPDVLRVPAYALLQGDRVLVVRGGTLVAVPVTTGLRNWDFVEITSGLAAGDPVVVSLDRPEVVAGARARIESETAK